MRRLPIVAALIVLAVPAFAQQRPPAPNRAPPPPQAQQQQPAQQQQAAPPPGLFPCRTANEVCHVVVATAGNQGTLLFSSAPQGEGTEGRTIAVQGADLAPHIGKVVMLTGELGSNGIANAQVVDVAGPLLSFAIKLQMSGGGSDEEDEAPAPAPQQQRSNAPPARSAPAPRR